MGFGFRSGQGGWWDVGSPSDLDRVNLREINEVTFSSNVRFYESGNINPNYAYTDSSAGNISVFWIGLGPSDLINGGTLEYEDLSTIWISPNPTYGRINIHNFGKNEITDIRKIEIYNFTGTRHYETNNLSNIDVSAFPAGIYILSIINKKGIRKWSVFIKH